MLWRLVVAVALREGLMEVWGLAQRWMPAGDVREVVGVLASFVAVLFALWFVARVMEGRSPIEAAGLGRRGAARQIALGCAMGAGYFGLLLAIAWATGHASFQGRGNCGWPMAFGLLLVFVVVALTEEIFYRGLLFRLLDEGIGSWPAILLSSAYFGLHHLRNRNASLEAGLAIAVEAGLLLAACYLQFRSLWSAIGLHWVWNFIEGPLLGLPVSGTALPSLFRVRLEGSTAWTGGAFGPEASVPATLLGLAFGLALLALAARGGQLRPARFRPFATATPVTAQ